MSVSLGGSSRALAVGIANIIKIFPSPTVILNGIYNDYQAHIRPMMEEEIESELSNLGLSAPSILFGEPIEFKTSIGAAYRAMDAFLEHHLESKDGLDTGPLRK